MVQLLLIENKQWLHIFGLHVSVACTAVITNTTLVTCLGVLRPEPNIPEFLSPHWAGVRPKGKQNETAHTNPWHWWRNWPRADRDAAGAACWSTGHFLASVGLASVGGCREQAGGRGSSAGQPNMWGSAAGLGSLPLHGSADQPRPPAPTAAGADQGLEWWAFSGTPVGGPSLVSLPPPSGRPLPTTHIYFSFPN